MSRKPHSKSPFTIEDFFYLPEPFLPALILGIYVPASSFRSDLDSSRDYHFKRGREWKKIAHQTAGLACHQHYIIGTILKPTDHALEGMRILSKKWLDTNVGLGGGTLDELNEYRADLKRLFGADCNRSHRHFEEGFYGIDIEFARILTGEKLPWDDLDSLIEWKSGFDRAIGCINRWGLWVLGENCD